MEQPDFYPLSDMFPVPRSAGPGRARLLSASLAWDMGGCVLRVRPARHLVLPLDAPSLSPTLATPEAFRGALPLSLAGLPKLPRPLPSLLSPLSSPWRSGSSSSLVFSAWFPPPTCAHNLVFSPKTEPTPDVLSRPLGAAWLLLGGTLSRAPACPRLCWAEAGSLPPSGGWFWFEFSVDWCL